MEFYRGNSGQLHGYALPTVQSILDTESTRLPGLERHMIRIFLVAGLSYSKTFDYLLCRSRGGRRFAGLVPSRNATPRPRRDAGSFLIHEWDLSVCFAVYVSLFTNSK